MGLKKQTKSFALVFQLGMSFERKKLNYGGLCNCVLFFRTKAMCKGWQVVAERYRCQCSTQHTPKKPSYSFWAVQSAPFELFSSDFCVDKFAFLELWFKICKILFRSIKKELFGLYQNYIVIFEFLRQFALNRILKSFFNADNFKIPHNILSILVWGAVPP